MSVSMATPSGNTPSIHDTLETISSRPPSTIVTDDINRLLNYLHEIEGLRGDDNKHLADNIREIKDELMNLSDFLRNQPTHVTPVVVDIPPPVPHKDRLVKDRSVEDRSVGGSISISSTRPVGPRQGKSAAVDARLVPIPLTPPPMRIRPSSPSSISETMSFLSSHHSDDYSLMESEEYPAYSPYPRAASPSISESSFASSLESSVESAESAPVTITEDLGGIRRLPSPSPETVSVPPQEPALPPLPEEAPMTEPEPVIILDKDSSDISTDVSSDITESLPTSGDFLSRSSSPLSVASDVTARPREGPDDHLRDLLEQLRDQTAALRDGQMDTNAALEDMRQRGNAPDLVHVVDKMNNMEGLLQDLLNQMRERGPPIPPRDISEELTDSGSETSSAMDRLRQRWEELNQERREPPTIYMPTPIRLGPSLEDQLADMIGTGLPPMSAAPQPPPALIPLVYRPVPRASRPRSASPTSFADVRRSLSAPIPDLGDLLDTGRPLRRPRRASRTQGTPGTRRGPNVSEGVSMPASVVHLGGSVAGPQVAGSRPQEGADIDFLNELRRLRRGRGRGRSGYFSTQPAGPVMVSNTR
jgi:hypothetical protein